MPSFMDSGSMDHPSQTKRSLDRPLRVDHKDADGKGCNSKSAMSTMETMPTLSDWHRLSDHPAANNLDDHHDWDRKDHVLDDMDVMDEIAGYEHFLTSERSSDEGRRCDFSYIHCHDDLLNEPFHNCLNDSLLSELHPESIATKTFSFPEVLKQNDEVGQVQKPIGEFSICSSAEEKGNTVSFCNRRFKIIQKKHDGEEDFEAQFLAEVSILTQIAQHAKDLVTANSTGVGRQVLAGPHFGRQVSAPVDDRNFAHGFGSQVTTPLPSHCKSPTSKHGLVACAVLDDAVEMDKTAKSPGRASWKMAYDVDQDQDMLMHASKDFGQQVSSVTSFRRNFYAPAEHLNFDLGLCRQVSATLPSHSRSLTLKNQPVDLAVLDEAVAIDAVAGPPGRALRKMAQHADQARDPFIPNSKDFCRQISVGGRQVSAPVDDLKFALTFGRQVTASLPSHARSLTLKHALADFVVLDDAVEMDEVAGPPGRALRKMVRHADEVRHAFMPNSKYVGQQVSARPTFGRQVFAPDSNLNFADGSGHQITARLSPRPQSLRRFSRAD